MSIIIITNKDLTEIGLSPYLKNMQVAQWEHFSEKGLFLLTYYYKSDIL